MEPHLHPVDANVVFHVGPVQHDVDLVPPVQHHRVVERVPMITKVDNISISLFLI